MKKVLYIILASGLLMSCNTGKKEKSSPDQPLPAYSRVELRSDTLNLVKRTDTLVIDQSVCIGCAYEESASFSVHDSLGLVELYKLKQSTTIRPMWTEERLINTSYWFL